MKQVAKDANAERRASRNTCTQHSEHGMHDMELFWHLGYGLFWGTMMLAYAAIVYRRSLCHPFSRTGTLVLIVLPAFGYFVFLLKWLYDLWCIS